MTKSGMLMSGSLWALGDLDKLLSDLISDERTTLGFIGFLSQIKNEFDLTLSHIALMVFV